MAKDFTRNLMAFVVVVVVGYVAFTMFTGGQVGFATADTCHGNPTLVLNPITVQAGDNVIAGVTGLKGCTGQVVYLKDGDCNAQTITSYTCTNSICNRKVAFQKNVVGRTQISACMDKNNNDWFFDPEERSTATLTVVTQPDLTVDKITLSPENPTDKQTFKIIANVKNMGALAVTNIEIELKISQEPYKGEILSDIQRMTIPIKSEADVTFRAISLASGTYTVEITTDPDKRIMEFDRSNDVFTTSLTIP